MFGPELHSIIDTGGFCPRTLWTQTCIWSENIPADTEWIEGVNNTIIQIVLNAPVIREPLLSSRAVTSTALSTGVAAHGRPSPEEINNLVTRAYDHFREGELLLEDIDRYATPAPAASKAAPRLDIQPQQHSQTTMLWARHYNAKFIRRQREAKG